MTRRLPLGGAFTALDIRRRWVRASNRGQHAWQLAEQTRHRSLGRRYSGLGLRFGPLPFALPGGAGVSAPTGNQCTVPSAHGHGTRSQHTPPAHGPAYGTPTIRCLRVFVGCRLLSHCWSRCFWVALPEQASSTPAPSPITTARTATSTSYWTFLAHSSSLRHPRAVPFFIYIHCLAPGNSGSVFGFVFRRHVSAPCNNIARAPWCIPYGTLVPVIIDCCVRYLVRAHALSHADC